MSDESCVLKFEVFEPVLLCIWGHLPQERINEFAWIGIQIHVS